MLVGTEVKALRTGKATIAESYASVDRDGRGLSDQRDDPGVSIQGNRFNHEPKRHRESCCFTPRRSRSWRRGSSAKA